MLIKFCSNGCLGKWVCNNICLGLLFWLVWFVICVISCVKCLVVWKLYEYKLLLMFKIKIRLILVKWWFFVNICVLMRICVLFWLILLRVFFKLFLWWVEFWLIWLIGILGKVCVKNFLICLVFLLFGKICVLL